MANHVFQEGGWWWKSAKCTEGIIKTASRLTYVLLHTCTLFQFSLSLVISYKKRRVADLLSNFIPDGEATLMKNGRWFCFIPGCLGQCLTHSNSQSHSQRNVLSPTVDTAALCVLTVLCLTLLICSWCTGRESDTLKVRFYVKCIYSASL